MSAPAPSSPKMSVRRIGKWIRACESVVPVPSSESDVAIHVLTMDHLKRDRKDIILACRREIKVPEMCDSSGAYSEVIHRGAVVRWWNKRFLDCHSAFSGGGGLTLPRRPARARATYISEVAVVARCTVAERAAITAKAREAGVSVSDLLRMSVGVMVPPAMPKPAAVSQPPGDPELKRLGGLLNQAIRALHVANKYGKSDLIPRATALCGQAAAHITAKLKAAP